MHSIIDYVGSMVTGGVIFVMMMGYYINVSTTSVVQVFNTTTQEDITSITEIIEYDMRKAGYGLTDSVAFAVADSHRIAIRGDFDNNGTADTIRYWLSDTQMPGTASPQARTLYRRAGNTTRTLTTNPVTRFMLWYYDENGNATTNPNAIRFARIALQLESKVMNDGRPVAAYWERVIRPQNVR